MKTEDMMRLLASHGIPAEVGTFFEWVRSQPIEVARTVSNCITTINQVFENELIVHGPGLVCPDWWSMQEAAAQLVGYATSAGLSTAMTFFQGTVDLAGQEIGKVGASYTDDCLHLLIVQA